MNKKVLLLITLIVLIFISGSCLSSAISEKDEELIQKIKQFSILNKFLDDFCVSPVMKYHFIDSYLTQAFPV